MTGKEVLALTPRQLPDSKAILDGFTLGGQGRILAATAHYQLPPNPVLAWLAR